MLRLLWIIPVGLLAGFLWLVSWQFTDAGRAHTAQRAAQIEQDKLPRKTSEANGCEVWAFKPADRWLYFTRCDARTETTNSWEVCRSVNQGKSTRTECTPHSTVVTQETKKEPS